MEENSVEWIKMAEDNLTTAKILYENERFRDAAYYSQQVAEKALKAVQVSKFHKFDKIHDLLELSERIKAPKEVAECAKKLTRYYIDTRYPLPEERNIDEKDAEYAINLCEEVLKWAKVILKS